MKNVSRMVVAALCAIATTSVGLAADGIWTNVVEGQLWSVTGNWQDGTVADGTGSTARFDTLDITADTTVQLDGPRTLGALIFDDTDTTSAAGWMLGNNGNAVNVLTLAGDAPAITVGALGEGKAAHIGVTIAGADGLTKAGAGTLVLAHTNRYSGATTVAAGELRLAPAADLFGTLPEPPASGLALWLDATQGVATNAGGNVTQWTDRSGNNHHATNALSTGPTLTADIGGLPTLRFTSSASQYLDCGGIVGITDITVFIVNKLASVSTSVLRSFFCAAGTDQINGETPIHYQIATSQKINFWVNQTFESHSSVTAGTVQINEYIENNLQGRYYRNGMADGSKKRSISRKRLDVFRIGAWMPFSTNTSWHRFLDGSIGEILIYTRALSEDERRTVGRYLAAKWGVSDNAYGNALNVLPAQTAVTVNDGATLALAGVDQTIAVLSGATGSQLLLGGTLTVDGSQTTTFAGDVSGYGGLVVKGGSALALTGTADYRASTYVEDGTLTVEKQLYKGGAAPDAQLDIRDGGLLALGTWGATPYDALGQFPTAANHLFISNGTVRVTGTTFGERAATVAGTATLEAAAGANWHVVADGAPWVFDAGAGLLLTGDGSGCFAKGFNGSGGITKTGTGRWTLSGADTLNGPIAVEAGTLQVASGQLSAIPVPGADLWLDATRGVETDASGKVTRWADLSGFGRDATSANGPTVTTDINGQQTLRFTRANANYLECFGLRNMTNLTVFMINKLASLPSDYFALLAEDSTRSNAYGCAIHYNIDKDKKINYWVGGTTPSSGALYYDTLAQTDTPQIYEILDENGETQFFINGASAGGGTRSTHQKRLDDFRIGAWNNSRYLDGSIGEIIIYTRVLNATERAAVYAYLNAKWLNPAGIGTPAPGTGTLLAADAAVSVSAGATLDLGGQSHACATVQGSGTVTNGSVAATIQPGGTGQVGTLHVAATLFGTLVIDAMAGACDHLQVTGDLDLSGLRLEFSGTSQLNQRTQYEIAAYTGALTAPFGEVAVPGSWEVRYTADKRVKLICHAGTLISIR
ncbi:MAG TPA: autotransporter-associated beta strand repeat-containing protein [Kiritimatiellia bacterium]|nr:autotransporter-associated beta strand repeat-containing protein [Kiritimatiellia bacterium]